MHIYSDDGAIRIRSMELGDAMTLHHTYASYGWHPQLQTYVDYFAEQEAGERLVFIAECGGEVKGQCTLEPQAHEGPWAGQQIPVITDLTVFFDAHGKGIGTRLMDAAEAEAAKAADRVCLAVGLHSGYGPAQRMYVKRGYVPDGSGVWYRGSVLDQYAPCVNDDELLLWLSKKLR